MINICSTGLLENKLKDWAWTNVVIFKPNDGPNLSSKDQLCSWSHTSLIFLKTLARLLASVNFIPSSVM